MKDEGFEVGQVELVALIHQDAKEAVVVLGVSDWEAAA